MPVATRRSFPPCRGLEVIGQDQNLCMGGSGYLQLLRESSILQQTFLETPRKRRELCAGTPITPVFRLPLGNLGLSNCWLCCSDISRVYKSRGGQPTRQNWRIPPPAQFQFHSLPKVLAGAILILTRSGSAFGGFVKLWAQEQACGALANLGVNQQNMAAWLFLLCVFSRCPERES